MSVFERSVVDKLIKKGSILKWYRYVDDIFCILETKDKEKVYRQLNSWDSHLKLTIEEMTDSGLVFLDCRVFYSDGKLQFIKHRKLGEKTVLSNFALSITSKKYLKNGIFGRTIRNLIDQKESTLFVSTIMHLVWNLMSTAFLKR